MTNSAGILSDSAILDAVKSGDINIDPYNPAHVNAASYDVTLGDQITVYRTWVDFNSHYQENTLGPRDGRDLHPVDRVLDVKDETDVASFTIDPKVGWVLKPNIGYLMHTKERIQVSRRLEPVLDGKSSTGRLFMHIHVTAGYGDPGFDGQFTLEVLVRHPLRVYPGMRIGQVRFHTLAGEVQRDYSERDSSYRGATASGAIPSRAWRQFRKSIP